MYGRFTSYLTMCANTVSIKTIVLVVVVTCFGFKLLFTFLFLYCVSCLSSAVRAKSTKCCALHN